MGCGDSDWILRCFTVDLFCSLRSEVEALAELEVDVVLEEDVTEEEDALTGSVEAVAACRLGFLVLRPRLFRDFFLGLMGLVSYMNNSPSSGAFTLIWSLSGALGRSVGSSAVLAGPTG